MQQDRVDAPPPPYPLWLYAAVHTGNPGDCEYYATCCDGAATVLEIGCGTGRISSALLRAGCRVTGIDCSAEAVAIANSRNVDARVADMRDFDLGRQFDVVIAPYNVLYCCLSEADLLATFRCIKSHLRADGRFIFDVYCADSLLYGVDLLNTESSRGPLVDEEDGPILHRMSSASMLTFDT
jgi:SAM-dependent methyltransferase